VVLKRAGSVVELDGSVHCARVSELLEQPVNATCHPSFVWKLSSTVSHYIPSTDVHFLIIILSSSLKTVFTNVRTSGMMYS